MTRRKTNETSVIEIGPSDFAELVGYTVDSQYNPWDSVDHATLIRLVAWVARGGGLVSMGGASDGTAIYCSVRLDNKAKSFQFDKGEQFNEWAGRVADAWAVKWRNAHPEARK